MARCFYTCSMCPLKDVPVEVAPRDRQYNVVQWMKKIVVPALMADHKMRAPRCRAKSFADIKVPIEAAQILVGDETIH